MMTCNEFRNRVADLFDREADPQLRAELERHIGECPQCRAYYEELMGADELLRPRHSPVTMPSLGNRPVGRRHSIAAPLIGVAASLVLLLVSALYYKETKTNEPPATPNQMATADTVNQAVPVPMPQTVTEVVAVAQKESEPRPQRHRSRRKVGPRQVPPDTLGNDIWQDERNVMLALEMLQDCEATIEQGERTLHNEIIEATFRATPQSPHAILVCNELGEYEVIETSNAIEI